MPVLKPPKPGDPDWIPRHPVLDLAPIEQRIAERRTYVGPAKEAVDADTEMMEALLLDVKNLRLANAILRGEK